MEQLVNIRLDLDINAQKIIQQVQLHNGNVEDQIAKGIELALNDLCEGDNFVQQIREATKVELSKIVHRAILKWDTQQAIEKAVSEKIAKKIEEYADRVAEQVTANLK
jgi:polyribonucleotide nucleotidyltransferase